MRQKTWISQLNTESRKKSVFFHFLNATGILYKLKTQF